MQPFTRMTSNAAVLPDADIDTDTIFPARFLLITSKAGLGRYAFYEKRFKDGVERTDFPLARTSARATQILVAGDNFGCGSSREQAVWALHDLGVRAILSTSFGEIFYSNCFKSGLLPIVLPASDIALFRDAAERGELLTADLVRQEVSAQTVAPTPFHVESWRRNALLKGWDEVMTLLNTQADALLAFEQDQRAKSPWLFAAD